MTLHAALSSLLSKLEAGDAAGAAEVLPWVQQGLSGVQKEEDLLALRLLNGRCEEAAKYLLDGIARELQGSANSSNAMRAYGGR